MKRRALALNHAEAEATVGAAIAGAFDSHYIYTDLPVMKPKIVEEDDSGETTGAIAQSEDGEDEIGRDFETTVKGRFAVEPWAHFWASMTPARTHSGADPDYVMEAKQRTVSGARPATFPMLTATDRRNASTQKIARGCACNELEVSGSERGSLEFTAQIFGSGQFDDGSALALPAPVKGSRLSWKDIDCRIGPLGTEAVKLREFSIKLTADLQREYPPPGLFVGDYYFGENAPKLEVMIKVAGKEDHPLHGHAENGDLLKLDFNLGTGMRFFRLRANSVKVNKSEADPLVEERNGTHYVLNMPLRLQHNAADDSEYIAEFGSGTAAYLV